MMKIDISLPVYNEGGNIGKTLALLDAELRKLPEGAAEFSINIIYDFDEDNTLPVVKRLQDGLSAPVRYTRNEKPGVINALKKGFACSEADYVLVSMADASDDYSILPRLVELAGEGYDVICPSRYMRGGKLYGGPFIKQLLSRLAGLSMHFLTGIPTHDMTNSYRLYCRKAVEELEIESRGGFEIGMEITAKIYVSGGSVVELPCRWWDRTEGESRFSMRKWLPLYLKWYFFLLFSRRSKRRNNTSSG